MKQKFFLIFAAMLSTALLARQATNAPAPIETPAAAPAATNATAAPTNAPGTNASGKAEKKKAATKKKAEKKAVRKPDPAADLKIAPLVPGPAVVVASNVNVRGQAKLKSEIVTRVNKGQNLNVLEEVRLSSRRGLTTLGRGGRRGLLRRGHVDAGRGGLTGLGTPTGSPSVLINIADEAGINSLWFGCVAPYRHIQFAQRTDKRF